MVPANSLASKKMYYLDVVRVIAIISITLNHAVNRSYANYYGQMEEFYAIPLIATLFKTVITVFSHIGIPLFMMITGVLILNKPIQTGEDIKKFYKHNLLSLLITVEIWYALSYWYLVLFNGANMVLEERGIIGAILGMFETMLFQNQVTFDSMWYMPIILCLYTTLPFVIIVKDKLSESKFSGVVLLPLIVVYLNNMVRPALNFFLDIHGQTTYASAIQMSDLVSYFYLYIIIGYFIGKGALAKWNKWLVAGVALFTFAICCGCQLYIYSQPVNYVINYNFPLLPICAGAMFELARRGANKLKSIERPITYLSRIAFAIYLLHIVIMTTLNCDAMKAFMNYSAWDPALKLMFLEIVSVGGSVAVIAVLSKVPLLKKYLFMIK